MKYLQEFDDFEVDTLSRTILEYYGETYGLIQIEMPNRQIAEQKAQWFIAQNDFNRNEISYIGWRIGNQGCIIHSTPAFRDNCPEVMLPAFEKHLKLRTGQIVNY